MTHTIKTNNELVMSTLQFHPSHISDMREISYNWINKSLNKQPQSGPYTSFSSFNKKKKKPEHVAMYF